VTLDAVGGPVLGAALQRVAPGGIVVSFASTVAEPVSYPTRALFGRAPGARLYGLFVFSEVQHTGTCSSDLRRLAELIAARKLDPQIAMQVSWELAGEAVDALMNRRVNGKAVLAVDS
jgi:NADPH2:quinone reductase